MMYDTIIKQATIETDRMDLRPLRPSDQGLIDVYAGDLQVARMTTSIPHPLPPGATDAFIKSAQADDRKEHVWALDGLKSNGAEVMGLISLEEISEQQAEIGYWVAPPFWNIGIAQEAVRSLIDANPLNSQVLFASVFQDNPASARVLSNCGFQYLGDAETFSVARDAAVPTWTYSLKLN